MGKIFALAGVALIAALAVGYDLMQAPEVPVREMATAKVEAAPAPRVPFTTLDGRAFADFQALAEPVVIVNFWASWCAPCLVEMPAMLALAETLDGVAAFVFVSVDDDRAAMEAFRKKLGVAADNTHVYWVWEADKNLSLTHFNALKVPETIIMDAERRMVRKLVGEFDWATPATARWLRDLGQGSPTGPDA